MAPQRHKPHPIVKCSTSPFSTPPRHHFLCSNASFTSHSHVMKKCKKKGKEKKKKHDCMFVSTLCVISCSQDLCIDVFVEVGSRHVPKAHQRTAEIILYVC